MLTRCKNWPAILDMRADERCVRRCVKLNHHSSPILFSSSSSSARRHVNLYRVYTLTRIVYFEYSVPHITWRKPNFLTSSSRDRSTCRRQGGPAGACNVWPINYYQLNQSLSSRLLNFLFRCTCDYDANR